MTEEIKAEIAGAIRKLYRRGLTTTGGGNVSARGDNGSLFITRSGPDKGELTSADICEISSGGENLSSGLTPSMETQMHLRIYRTRPDVNAVVHSHTPVASAFSATGMRINTSLTGESHLMLGRIERVASRTMGSEALADAAAIAAERSDVIMILNHGPVCLGKSVMEAYSRMEVLEHTARMTLITHLLGNCSELSTNALEEIDALFGNR